MSSGHVTVRNMDFEVHEDRGTHFAKVLRSDHSLEPLTADELRELADAVEREDDAVALADDH